MSLNNRMRTRSNAYKQVFQTRNNLSAHSPFHFNTQKTSELRKSLFASALKIPGRKFKLWVFTTIFTMGFGNMKISEIKMIYGYSSF